MPRLIRSSLLAVLLLAAIPARADLVADAEVTGYDFVLSSIAFKGKSATTSHTFPVSTSHAPQLTLKLTAGKPDAVYGGVPMTCEYEMSFAVMNAGPGDFKVGDGSKFPGIPIRVLTYLPDGSSPPTMSTSISSEGCGGVSDPGKGAYWPAGAGCTTTEQVIFAVGKTRLIWKLDEDRRYKEYSDNNNIYDTYVVVGPNCEPPRPIASVVPPPTSIPPAVPPGVLTPSSPSYSGAIPSVPQDSQVRSGSSESSVSPEAIARSRDSLTQAFRFTGPRKPFTRPVPRNASQPAPAARQPPVPPQR